MVYDVLEARAACYLAGMNGRSNARTRCPAAQRSVLVVAAGASLAVACGAGADDAETASDATAGPMVACDQESTHDGQATYYDFADGSGACGFPATPNDLMVGAMNAPDYGHSDPCGACARVAGPEGEVTIRVVDLCPECPQGNIDLSPDAFAKIAPLERGRVPISWQYVSCDVSGPLTYHFKDGSNQWWTAVQLRNLRNAVSKLEYEKDGEFVAVERLDYNYFVEANGMGPGPYTFRVTDVHGSRLTDKGIAGGDDVDRNGAEQFPACE
jgi:expansin (peptidoglycan-binding protein)